MFSSLQNCFFFYQTQSKQQRQTSSHDTKNQPDTSFKLVADICRWFI